jgi:RNA polymerase sigma-70 factor, ECF subfamily
MDDEIQRELPHLAPRLWRFALRLTQHQADAEDLLQRSYLRALERRTQWQTGTSLISWVFAIMHSIWMNELRSAQRRREGNLIGYSEDEDPSTAVNHAPSADPELSLMCTQVLESVTKLPEAQRVVIVLVAIEGLSYREAADVLDLPIGTVMSRLARARLAIGQKFLMSPEAKSYPIGVKQ